MTHIKSRITREKKIVELMIRLYCKRKERNRELCPACQDLLKYAHARLEHCPFGEKKSTCRLCTVHCYKPEMRQRMQRYIEYKNKTQEKCNYCTIYQCISGFYKKNVELHLLLILAIDSVIYSFYVTILLCKKAPVFD